MFWVGVFFICMAHGQVAQPVQPGGATIMCNSTDGSMENPSSCACGTNTCNATSGLFCDVSENQCADVPYCTHPFGATVNPSNCICGTDTCNTTSGLFCDVSENQCADVPICIDQIGTSSNTFDCMCGSEKCSAATGLYCEDSSCYGDCVNSNGRAVNDAKCVCGTNTCDATSGLFCDVFENKCADVPYCEVTDGSEVNPSSCICGTDTCDATSGLYCDVSKNQCADVPYCEVIDGSEVNPSSCICGTGTCDATTGLYCDGSACFDTCENTNGTSVNDAKCACGTDTCDATSGLFCDGSACFDTCENTNGTSVNDAKCACGTDTCDATSGLFCDGSACFDTCENTNGTSVNDAKCACGTDTCDATSGLYCDGDGATCFDTCKNTNGTSVNDAKCACGTDTCDAGLYCDGSENQCYSGACAYTGQLWENEDAPCQCGQTFCTQNQPYCSEEENVCYSHPKCQNTDQSVPISVACYCGTNTTFMKKKFRPYRRGKCNVSTAVIFDETTPNSGTTPDEQLENCATACNGSDGFLFLSSNGNCECQNGTTASCEFITQDISYVRYNFTATATYANQLCSKYEFCWQTGTMGLCSSTALCPSNPSVAVWEGTDCICSSDQTCAAGQYCYNDVACGTEGDGVLACGCQTSPIEKCGNVEGDRPVASTCQCGEKICSTGSYCNEAQNQCNKTQPIPSCDYIHQNFEACLCGSTLCEQNQAGVYCEAEINTCVAGASCGSIPEGRERDWFCAKDGYGNGFNDTARCHNSPCDKETDYTSCCVACDGNYSVDTGLCVFPCKNNMCNADNLMPATPGFCTSQACNDTTDMDTCCMVRDYCPEQNIACPNGNIREIHCDPGNCTTDICCDEKTCICSNGAAATGDKCPQNGAHICQTCHPNYWRNTMKCQHYTTCSTHQYISINATNVTDRICTDLTVCNNQQYVSKAATAFSDRVCTDIPVCSDQQYISTSDTKEWNCTNLTVCTDRQYISKEATNVTDRVCGNLAECAHGYGTKPPAGNETICHDWAPSCNSSDQYQSKSPSAWQNRVCSDLTVCTDQQYISTNATDTTDRVCSDLSVCTDQQYISKTATAFSDRACANLTTCSTRQYISMNATGVTDRICTDLTACTNQQYVSRAATAFSDRVCAECNFTGCVGCMEVNDCDYNFLSRAPGPCSNKTCVTINITRDEQQFEFSPTISLHEEQSYRFAALFTGEPAFYLNTSLGVTYWPSAAGLSQTGDYLWFSIGANFSGPLSYENNGAATAIVVEKDCKYEYTDWSPCTAVCGNGSRVGQLRILQQPTPGGHPCPTQSIRLVDCVGTMCKSNCSGQWSDWSVCNTSCGNGTQTKTFNIAQNASYGGQDCPDSPAYKPCNLPPKNGTCNCQGRVDDACGICGGDNATCTDCNGTVNGPARKDRCGVCDGNESTCMLRGRLQWTNLYPWLKLIVPLALLALVSGIAYAVIHMGQGRKTRTHHTTQIKKN